MVVVTPCGSGERQRADPGDPPADRHRIGRNSLHTAAFAAAAISPAADRAVIDGAAALALTALDYLSDPALRTACAGQFAAQGGHLDVPALLTPPTGR